jgi:hypothetical protein
MACGSFRVYADGAPDEIDRSSWSNSQQCCGGTGRPAGLTISYWPTDELGIGLIVVDGEIAEPRWS